jgi:cardiolipin synthase A/B
VSQTVETDWYDSLAPEFREGNTVQLLECGKEFFPALVAALDSARNEVYFETYIFENDASGQLVADALCRAAQRGAVVRLVTDGFGTGKFFPGFTAQFIANGVQHEVFRPEGRAFVLKRQRLRRLHRKLCVVDGTTAFVGGINVLDDYFDPNHGKLEAPRFDFAVRVQGPLLPGIHLAVARLWWQLSVTNRPMKRMRQMLGNTPGGAQILPKTITSTIDASGSIRAMFVPRDNARFRNRIEATYLLAIHHAKHEVLIANAYFLPGRRFRKALITAAKRGVRVRLLLQGRREYFLQHFASRDLYEELLQAGIEITEYKRSFLHAKVAVADDWATVGSSNIDPFSLLLAREANVVVQDAAFAAQLRQRVLAGAGEGGVPVVLADHAKRPFLARLMSRFAYGVLRVGVALTGSAGRY